MNRPPRPETPTPPMPLPPTPTAPAPAPTKASTMTPTPADATQSLRADLLALGWTLRFDGTSPMHHELHLAIPNDPAGLIGVELRSHPEIGWSSGLFGIAPDTGIRHRRGTAGRWTANLANLPAQIILAAARAAAEPTPGTVAEQLTAAGWHASREIRSEDGDHLIEQAWASRGRWREVEYFPPCRHEEGLWVIFRPHPNSASTAWVEDVDATGSTPPAIVAAIATA